MPASFDLSRFGAQQWGDAVARDIDLPSDGILGYFIDGAFRILVEARPAYYYVRFDNHSFREVPHKGRIGVPEDLNSWAAQNIGVKLGFDTVGEYSILGFRSSGETNNLLSIFGGAILSYPHSHGISGMDWIGVQSVAAGRILVADGDKFNSQTLNTIIDPGEGIGVEANLLVLEIDAMTLDSAPDPALTFLPALVDGARRRVPYSMGFDVNTIMTDGSGEVMVDGSGNVMTE